MKRSIISLITFLFLTTAAYAAPITLIDTTEFTATGTVEVGDLQSYGGSSVSGLEGLADYVIWKHFFTFIPPAAHILSGTLKVTLLDDEPDRNLFTSEFALGIAENGQWDLGEVDSGIYQYSINVATLEDGVFGVKLISVGDFSIERSELSITYEPVPEPSIILLMGAGLLGAGYFARKRRDV